MHSHYTCPSTRGQTLQVKVLLSARTTTQQSILHICQRKIEAPIRTYWFRNLIPSEAPPWNSDTPPRLQKGGIAWAVDNVFTVVIATVKHLTLPFKFDHKKLSIYLAWNPKTSQIHAISVHFQKETYLPRAFCALGTTARWLLGSSHGSNLRVQMGARVLLDHDGYDGTTASARKALKIAGKIEH